MDMLYLRPAKETLWIGWRVSGYRRVWKKTLKANPQIRDLMVELTKVSPKWILRLNHYFLLACLSADWVAVLRGRPLTKKQIQQLVGLSTVVAIADSWFDDTDRSDESILSLLMGQSPASASNDVTEKLVGHLMAEMLSNTNHSDSFRSALVDFWRSEKLSRAQGNQQLSAGEINQISVDKAFYTLMCARKLIPDALMEGEELVFRSMAASSQLMDDILDLYDDFHEGLRTMATHNPDAASLEGLVIRHVRSMVAAVRGVKVSASNQNRTIAMLAYFPGVMIHALRQYQVIQGRRRQIPLDTVDRSRMICDLDSWTVRLRILLQMITYPMERPVTRLRS